MVFFFFSLTIGAAIAIALTFLAKSPEPLIMLFVGLFESLKLLFYDIKGVFTGKKYNKNSSKRGMITIIFSYVFGDDEEEDPLEVEKKIINY